MLDNYIKKIEELILPEYYDRNNYKEKIILENNNNINDNNNNMNNNTSNTQQHNKIITSNIDSPILNSYHNSDINNNINITKPKQISSIKIEKLSSKNSKIENINNSNNNKNNNINKDKINNNKANNENDNIINNNNIENERKEELNKMKQENSGKLQNPEFEIISNSHNNTNSNIQNNITIKSNINNNNNNFIKINDKIYTQNDLLNLLEKIKSINLKNMSYRYEMDKYKNKIIELNKTNSEQKEEIEKLEKEKENLTQYLLKLEKLIRGQKSLSSNQSMHSNNLNTNSTILNTNKNKNFNVINNNHININNKNKNIKEKETIEMKKSYNLFNQSNIDVSIGGNNPYIVITDVNTKVQTTLNNKKELKNFLIRINKENLKLKNFQKKVFELSKNYDDLNSNLEETINKFSDLLNNNINNDENNNNNDNINKAEFLENYKILCEQINKTLELKQNEYNTLLEGKDEALYLLQEELFITSNELEDRKRDRINEQKIINSLQIEINDLNEKLDNNNKNNFISINSNNNKDDKNVNNLRTEFEAQKMTIPAKQVVNSIIKKIEKNFNMEDESNILLLNNINNSIK